MTGAVALNWSRLEGRDEAEYVALVVAPTAAVVEVTFEVAEVTPEVTVEVKGSAADVLVRPAILVRQHSAGLLGMHSHWGGRCFRAPPPVCC